MIEQLLTSPVLAALLLLAVSISLYILSQRLAGLAYSRSIMLADALAIISLAILIKEYHLLDWLVSLLAGISPTA
ncbi:MAG TPA: hypothetical protein EYP08_08630 [Pyrodictiaceae archaeon]|nr:hypothetical protein [Pyrodictiaceae archaeon]